MSWSSQRRSASTRSMRGMVTAEIAVALLALGLVLAGCAGVLGLVMLQGRCADVAAQVARELGRADQHQAQRARSQAPAGATVSVTERDGWVSVTVRASRSWGPIGPVEVSGNATARLELAAGAQPSGQAP